MLPRILLLLVGSVLVPAQYETTVVNPAYAIEIKRQFLDENQRLFRFLFDKYNKNIPPIYTKRDYINNTADIWKDETYSIPRDVIEIILIYAKLLEVDSARSLMSVIFEYSLYWFEPRLTWNISDFDGISHLYVNRKQIWVPEISPFDSMEVTDTRPEFKQIVTVSSSGLANFYVSQVVTTTCDMNITDFPFDTQNCSVKLMSYSFAATEIILNSTIYTTVHPNNGNDEWDVLSIDSFSEMLDANSSLQQINEFTFVMKRNPSYYTVLIIVPSFILTFLCVAGLFTSPIRADDIDKIAMGLTTIMSSVVMISVLSQSIPKTKKIPKLSNYVTLNLLTVSMAIIVAILVPKTGQLLFLVFRLFRCCYRKIRKIEKVDKTGEPSCYRRFTWLFKGLLTAAILVVFESTVIINLVTLLLNENTKEAFGFKK